MFETCFAGAARSIFGLDLEPATPDFALCSTFRAAFLTGGLVGILGLASLFNLILLSANPRNISHLIFSCISGLAAIAVLLPHETGEMYTRSKWITLQIFWIWLPVLLFWFVYVLFPALGRGRRRIDQKQFLVLPADEGSLLRLYGLAAQCGRRITTPAALGLSAGYFWWSLHSNAPPPFWMTEAAVAYLIATGLFTSTLLVTACYYRQQGSLVALVGYLCFALGIVVEAGGPGQVAAEQIRPQIAGVLGFVLSMVVLMGPNRYQMHRQLRRSRNVLHESNQKLRHLDVLKNRYIAGSAREMQIPLERMLERCMNIVEDPAYRLGQSQLQALSGVMDMARKIIRRNERAATLFQEREIHAEHFDALDFFEMLVVMLEEQLHPLRFRFDATACMTSRAGDSSEPTAIEILADRVLIETAFRELAENAAGHGGSQAILLRIVPDDRQPDRIELQFIESELSRSALQLYALTEEFQTGQHEVETETGAEKPIEARANDTQGIGLGLSLVRRIAESHGSQLRIANVPEERATVVFSFSVPRSGTPLRPPEVEWGLKHLQFLLRQNRTDQAADEARVLARRFPEYREQVRQSLEDSF